MARKRGEPDRRAGASLLPKVHLSYRARLKALAQRISVGTPQEVIHALCAAALMACAGAYPDPGLWSQFGLGVVGNLAADWIRLFGGKRKPSDAPSDLVHKVLDDPQAREGLFAFLRGNGMLWEEVRQLSPEVRQQLGPLLLEALQTYGVATSEDVNTVEKLVRGIDQKLDVLLGRMKPLPPTTPSTLFAVPFSRNPSFVGREDDLAKLHEMLRGGGPENVRPVGLIGMPGVGKTGLAVQYAYQYRADYPDGVFCLSPSEGKSLLNGLAHLARELGLGEPDADRMDIGVQQRLVSAFARYLSRHRRSLLILDDLDDPGSLQRQLIANVVLANLDCAVVFTTLRKDFDRNAFASCELTTLPQEASLQLLLEPGGPRRPVDLDSTELGAAREICAALGYLPLALEQAARFLARAPEVPLWDYLQRLHAEGAVRTVDEEMSEEEILGCHRAGVGATIRITLARFSQEVPEVSRVFPAIGLFRTPMRMLIHPLGLATGLAWQSTRGRQAPLLRALRALYDMHLLEELTDHWLRLHSLVWHVARETSGGPSAVSLLQDVKPEVRRLGVWLLARTRPPGAEEALISALGDPDDAVQALASWALGESAPKQARSAVSEVRQRLGSRRWEIAGKAMAEFGDPEAAYTAHRHLYEDAMARLAQQRLAEEQRPGRVRGMPKRMR